MARTDASFSGTVGADGTCTVTVRVTNGQRWSIGQVSTDGVPNVAGTAECRLKKNGNLVTLLAPEADVASGDPPVDLNVSDRMTVEWTGADVGADVEVFIIYDDGVRAA